MIKKVNFYLEDFDAIVLKERLRENGYTIGKFCELIDLSSMHMFRILRGEHPINERIKEKMIQTQLFCEEDFTEEGFMFDYYKG